MKEFIKFFGLGGISTLVDYAIYLMLISLGLDYVVSIVFGYAAGFWINYSAGRKYVFTQGSKLSSSHKEFIRVFSIAFVGLLLNITLVNLLSLSIYSLDFEYSRLIAIVIVFVYNYGARKLLVYN